MREGESRSRERRGVLSWFARNRVPANLLLLVFLIGGLTSLPRLNREVFPEAELDLVLVRVPYPGANPAEVEQGILLAIEEEVRGIDGVEEVRSVAQEGLGIVLAELRLGADADRALSDVEGAVGRVSSLPEAAEEPTVSVASNRRQVISLIFHGEPSFVELRELASEARRELLQLEGITLVQLSGVPEPEIGIEISRAHLRRHQTDLVSIADRVRSASNELSGGEVETPAGEVLLRTDERLDTAEEYRDLALFTDEAGGIVRLDEVADVREGLRETDMAAHYDSERAVRVDVFRVGDERPLEISRSVREYVEDKREDLPPGVDIAVWNDTSEIFEGRIALVLENGYIGLALVLLLLGALLDPKLAFWVALGIPVSFIGAILLLPATSVSINLISLFAFLVTLGLVVDDAIIVGEAIYEQRRQGKGMLEAAIAGAREVARPVLFAITTTALAFSPMLFVPAMAGELFRNIPVVALLVLAVSLVESLLILPAHLGHPMPSLLGVVLWPFLSLMKLLRSDAISRWLERFVEKRYRPLAKRALEHRYLTLALAAAALALTVGGFTSGRRTSPNVSDASTVYATSTQASPEGNHSSTCRSNPSPWPTG